MPTDNELVRICAEAHLTQVIMRAYAEHCGWGADYDVIQDIEGILEPAGAIADALQNAGLINAAALVAHSEATFGDDG
jgi:hypothetical protein